MQLGHLSEVILYVRDMATQVTFYRYALGLKVAWPTDLADYSAEHWVTFATGSCTLALHSGGTAPSGAPPRFGFDVRDIGAVRAELVTRSVSLGDVRSPAPGVLICDAIDPEGNGFFIEQRERR